VTPAFTGQCLCGRVTYVAKGDPVIVAQCHCEECRRLSGTGHAIGAMFAVEDVDIQGAFSAFKYLSGKGSEVTKAFCPECGSPLFGRNSSNPTHLTLAMGSLDDASCLKIDVVIFARDRPAWDQLDNDVACFQTQPDWTPKSD